MHRFVQLFLVVIIATDFLSRSASRYFTLVPEMLAGVALLMLIFRLARDRTVTVSPVYPFLFSLLFVHIICGAVANQVDTGTLVSGLRGYLKYFPLFFLPVAFKFSDDQLRAQLRLLLVLAVMQLPLGLYQRFFVTGYGASGDVVKGTLDNAGSLTVFLMSCIAMWVAFYATNRVTMRRFAVVLLLLFMPNTLNESKSTAILLPFSLLVPLLLLAERAYRRRLLAQVAVLGVALGVIFVPVYGYFLGNPDKGIVEFFATGRIVEYLAPQRGKTIEEVLQVENTQLIGRLDALRVAATYIAQRPTTLMFGLGAGNVSSSVLGEGFDGEYFEKFEVVVYGEFSVYLWELGLLGVILIAWLNIKIVRDALRVRRLGGIRGALGLGWASATLLLILSLFYSRIGNVTAIGYLFFYLSGYIAWLAAEARLAPSPTVNPKARQPNAAKLDSRSSGTRHTAR